MTVTSADDVRLGIDEVVGSEREAILALARRYRASNVRVFGSVARGEARPDSDLDLLVDFAPDYTLWDKIGLIQDLRALMGRRVDVAVAEDLRAHLREAVLREAVAL